MQKWIQNSAGVAGGEQRAGLDGDKNEPENRGDPGLENVVAVGVQEGRELSVPPFAENEKDGAPSICFDWRGLLDAIVGGLAGDHYVVDVTLAESGAADADEARFLEEFGDGGATAVAHARSKSADHLMD